jgi:hypothetical protein
MYVYKNTDVCTHMYVYMPIYTYRQNEVRNGKKWAEMYGKVMSEMAKTGQKLFFPKITSFGGFIHTPRDSNGWP